MPQEDTSETVQEEEPLVDQFTYIGQDKSCIVCRSKQMIGFYSINDGKVCSMCLDVLKFKCHVSYENIHNLTSKKASKLIKGISLK